MIPLPSESVAVKLASIAKHTEEALMTQNAHAVDFAAIETLMRDPEVHEYMEKLRALALLPVPR